MDEQLISKARNQVNTAFTEMQRGRRAEASEHFHQAILTMSGLTHPVSTRNELSAVAEMTRRCGFYDLTLLAAGEAVALDQQLKNVRDETCDLLTMGNAHLRLGNRRKANRIYERARALAVANRDLANAAAAQTNLAAIAVKSSALAEAAAMLKQSLEYLEAEPHAGTELNTRIMFIQVLDHLQVEPEEIVKQGRTLLGRFAHSLQSNELQAIEIAMKRAIDELASPTNTPKQSATDH